MAAKSVFALEYRWSADNMIIAGSALKMHLCRLKNYFTGIITIRQVFHKTIRQELWHMVSGDEHMLLALHCFRWVILSGLNRLIYTERSSLSQAMYFIYLLTIEILINVHMFTGYFDMDNEGFWLKYTWSFVT